MDISLFLPLQLRGYPFVIILFLNFKPGTGNNNYNIIRSVIVISLVALKVISFVVVTIIS